MTMIVCDVCLRNAATLVVEYPDRVSFEVCIDCCEVLPVSPADDITITALVTLCDAGCNAT